MQKRKREGKKAEREEKEGNQKERKQKHQRRKESRKERGKARRKEIERGEKRGKKQERKKGLQCNNDLERQETSRTGEFVVLSFFSLSLCSFCPQSRFFLAFFFLSFFLFKLLHQAGSLSSFSVISLLSCFLPFSLPCSLICLIFLLLLFLHPFFASGCLMSF